MWGSTGVYSCVLGALALLAVLAWAMALAYTDIRFRRLPDLLTLPAGFISLWWLSPAALAWPTCYWGLAMVRGGIGGGDIKLALPLGVIVAAHTGLPGVIAAMAVASLCTLAWLVVARGRDAPHGPGMLIAAAVVCLGAQVV